VETRLENLNLRGKLRGEGKSRNILAFNYKIPIYLSTKTNPTVLNCDMKELVDLYAKLLIGTFTFIGPSFTLLISLFQDHFERVKKEHESRRETWLKTDTKDKVILKQIKRHKLELNRLDPKRQVTFVYGTLLLSIALTGFYYFQHTHFWGFNYPWIRITTISISIALFLVCLIILWIVFGTIIDAKRAEQEAKKEALQKRKHTMLQTLKRLQP